MFMFMFMFIMFMFIMFIERVKNSYKIASVCILRFAPGGPGARTSAPSCVCALQFTSWPRRVLASVALKLQSCVTAPARADTGVGFYHRRYGPAEAGTKTGDSS